MKDKTKSHSDDPIRIPYFDWDKAKYFYFVVKLGGVTNAAKFLNIAQSAVSKKIQDIEDRINCKLLTRTPTGVKITRKGEELFAIIERTFLELKGFSYNAAVTSSNGHRRKLRISTTQPIAAYILSDHLLAYNQVHPEISFEVITNDHLIDVIINDVDIAIRPFNNDTSGIQQEHIFNLEKKLYASEKYLEIHGEPKTVEDLVNHRIVAQSDPGKHPYSDTNWILRLGMNPGANRDPIYTSNSLECLIDAVKEGIGIISCYEEMKIVKMNNLKQILPSTVGSPVQWFFAYPTYLKEDNQLQEFKNYLFEKISNLNEA